jgi:polyhydroxyalkanoate synthesis regulator phasin
MAKKGKPSKDKSSGRADAVRSAVDQAFSASAAQAEQGRERAQDIVDQLAQAAGRVRDVLDELRPPTGDELKSLRSTVEALERRVAALEAAQAAAAEPKPKPKRAPAKRKAAARPRGSSSGGGNPSGTS